MIALITGGSGCGKSVYAERLMDGLAAGERRYYIATMQVRDEESRLRVLRHRAQRAGRGYETVECPLDLGGAAVAEGACALLECLPNLVANEMFGAGDVTRVFPAIKALSRRCKHLIVVTNDVFSDGEPYTPEVQAYMQALAQLNARTAALADCAVEVVYSIPVPVKGALPCFG